MAGNRRKKNVGVKRPAPSNTGGWNHNNTTIPIIPLPKEINEEEKIEADGKKSYAEALNNEGQATSVFPRNLAPHLRKQYGTGSREQWKHNDRPQKNKEPNTERTNNGGTATAVQLKTGGKCGEDNGVMEKNPYGEKTEDIEGRQIPEELFRNVLKQLPPPPITLPPGKCLK
jgi:hypothetical protein